MDLYHHRADREQEIEYRFGLAMKPKKKKKHNSNISIWRCESNIPPVAESFSSFIKMSSEFHTHGLVRPKLYENIETFQIIPYAIWMRQFTTPKATGNFLHNSTQSDSNLCDNCHWRSKIINYLAQKLLTHQIIQR